MQGKRKRREVRYRDVPYWASRHRLFEASPDSPSQDSVTEQQLHYFGIYVSLGVFRLVSFRPSFFLITVFSQWPRAYAQSWNMSS